MSKTAEQQARSKQATDNGLVLVYFPNGTSYQMFEERCWHCRHQLESDDDCLPPKLEPPHNLCAWGVRDRILQHVLFGDEYGYGESAHDPGDIDPEPCPANCLRFTPDDYNLDDRDPPTPDVPGQMMLEESLDAAKPESLRVQELAK